jgi:hypothetical protein
LARGRSERWGTDEELTGSLTEKKKGEERSRGGGARRERGGGARVSSMMEKGLKGGDGAGGHGVEGWWCAVTEAGTLTLLSCVEDDKGEGYSLEGVSDRMVEGRWARSDRARGEEGCRLGLPRLGRL